MNIRNTKFPAIKNVVKNNNLRGPLYIMRYRNDIMTKILISPIGRSTSNNARADRKEKRVYKFTSITPNRSQIKKYEIEDFNRFQDFRLQRKYEELIKELKLTL